jgi:hypothetical protein
LTGTVAMPPQTVQYVQLGQAPNMAHPVMQYNGKFYWVNLTHSFYRVLLKALNLDLCLKKITHFHLIVSAVCAFNRISDYVINEVM